MPELYWEDVVEGSEIPALVKTPTTRQLVMYAGASGDFYAIHYDKDFAQSKGLPGVIVHGQLVAAFLAQMLTDWVAPKGRICKFSCSYKGMNLPGAPITCQGKVTKKFSEGGAHLVECSFWAQNPKGEKTASGKAVISLPVRG